MTNPFPAFRRNRAHRGDSTRVIRSGAVQKDGRGLSAVAVNTRGQTALGPAAANCSNQVRVTAKQSVALVNQRAIATALQDLRHAPTDEKVLQAWIDAAFTRAGLLFEREVETGTGPVDFVLGTIAIEVKIKGSPVAITRQLLRYLQTGRFTEAILITTRALSLPATLATERGTFPLTVLPLWKQFL